MKLFTLALLVTILALPVSAAETAKIPLADTETIVFLGDSITAWRINYSMYAQAFLVSRFPGKHLTIHSFGYGGQSAEYASTIYPTEVAAVKPTTVFVDYGMNDGRYKPFDEANNKWFLDSQRALARAIKASGAREVLLTTSPMDTEVRPDMGFYNETLRRTADSVIGLGKELQLPVADIFHPMLATQVSAKAARPGYTLQVDSVHPTPVGHLVMAYHLLNNIEMPRVAADIAIKDAAGAVPAVSSSAGAQPENVTVKDGAIDFDLALPFLPYYVPAEAREALAFVPFENDLNKFRLQATGWNPARKCALMVNKREVGVFTAAQLAAGIDLAQLEGAPWTDAAKKVNEIAALRPNRLDILPNYSVRNLPSFAKLAAANTEYMDELGAAMTSLAQPGKYHFSLVPADRG